ncbi:MAG TPA: hypothetical protein VF323_11585 [Candidatus Limnocylindrales bacterium]
MPPSAHRLVLQRVSALVASGLLAGMMAACAAGGASPSSVPGGTTILHPTGAGDLVLRYEEIGGFVAPEAQLTRYPIVSVYGDGTVITLGPVPAIFPGPALPNLVATKLTEAGLQRLLAAAATAGLLGPDAQFDATGIADATTARFTVVAAGSRHVISAYALREAAQGMEGGPAVAAARARLRAFTDRLGDLRGTLGPEGIGPEASFAWGSLRILAAAGAPPAGDPAVARPPLLWPLSTPLATFGAPGTGAAASFRCGVVRGADLDVLRPLLARATQITGWTSGGTTYTLTLLPMLPDDAGC